MLSNEIRHYNIQIFDKIIFFKYRTRQIKTTERNKKGKATVSIKMSNFLICFCILLSCLIK